MHGTTLKIMYMFGPNNTNYVHVWSQQHKLCTCLVPTTQIVSSLYNYFLTCLLVYGLLHDASIRSLPGGEVSILGGDVICHCEKEFHINMCQILNAYQVRAV
jgi:hypothetical protein